MVSQRARFYSVSAEAKLGFMQRVAGYSLITYLLYVKLL
jgi:hypothetical protein